MTHPIVEQDLRNIVSSVGADTQQLAGRTVLISGSCGFLGSYFTATVQELNRTVLKEPCVVIGLDNHITTRKNNLITDITDENIEFVTHDVRDPPHISVAVDYIVHMAGIASPAYYMKYPLEAIEGAVWGSKNLLDLARVKQVQGFLLFSSSEIYGDPDPNHVPMKEDYKGNVSCTGPRSCYDESKRLAETLAVVYHQKYAVPARTVRPFNVYGPGMRRDDYRVIPTFLDKAFKGEPLPVHGSGNQTRSFCYVTDAIAGFFKALLLGEGGESYNIGNDEVEVSMRELADVICAIFDGKAQMELIAYPDTYPQDEPQRRAPDLTKARSRLGYAPRVAMRDGLERAKEWFGDVHFGITR
jgi:UDP-glucuronate decarboxylase